MKNKKIEGKDQIDEVTDSNVEVVANQTSKENVRLMGHLFKADKKGKLTASMSITEAQPLADAGYLTILKGK